MSHLNANENATETSYTAVEMTDRPQPSSPSRESRFKPIHIVVSYVGRHWEENGNVKLVITALGIFLSYFLVGILQEKIMRGDYCDENGKCERFDYAVTLICVQFIFSFTFIKGKLQIVHFFLCFEQIFIRSQSGMASIDYSFGYSKTGGENRHNTLSVLYIRSGSKFIGNGQFI